MKKNLKIFMLILSLVVLVFASVSCGGGAVSDPDAAPEPVDNAANEPANEPAEEPADEPAEEPEPAVLADAINIYITTGNNQRTPTYQQSVPLELPDGTVISQGMLKPTWQYISDVLGIGLNDVAIQDQSSAEMIEVAAATGFDTATIYGGQAIGDDFMSYGAQGYFVNLNANLDMMPNFAAYLEANPNIAAAITAYDGGIYHIPYAAELGNFARVFVARESWVIALLDSEDALLDETRTLVPAYEGYWDRNATNVVDLQNEAAGGTLTRDVALTVLLDYIAATYPDLENPSDLYLGEGAAYDMDELIALLRVIKLSPDTLTALTTGEVVEGAEIYPFFGRRSRDRGDILRLVTYWGGQRVFGSDSYGAIFYLDEAGVLQYSHAEEAFLEGVDNLADMYAEGLIAPEFSDESNTENWRTTYITKDDEEGHLQFGFMTIDWIASTTAANPDMMAVLPPLTTVGSDEFIHFMENTRVIKPDGWAISAASTEEEINAALVLFDYFFTQEGRIVQNYGPPFCQQEGGVFTGMDGIDYPEFSEWVLTTATELKNGDVSSFLRDFVGSQIPIGYQKEIGFEWQYTKNRGWDSWALYIGQGVVNPSYEDADPLFRLVPPLFSLTEQDTARLDQLAVGGDQIDQIFLYITGAETAVDSVDALMQLYLDAGIEEYIEVYRNAYARMAGE